MTKHLVIGSLIGAFAIHGLLDILDRGFARPAYADTPHACKHVEVKTDGGNNEATWELDPGWTPWAATTVHPQGGENRHTVFLQRCMP